MRHPYALIYTEKLAGLNPSKNFPAINPSASWLGNLCPFCFQHCVNGDTWGCTNFSLRDATYILGNFLGLTVDYSVSYNAVDSGTRAGDGNSYDAPVTALINHWACPEADRVFTPNVTTLTEFFAPLTAEQKSAATIAATGFELDEDWLTDQKPDTIAYGLTISPVRIGVDGEYLRDAQGRIVAPANPVYDHVVVIVAIRPTDGAFVVFDSESMSIEYFAPNYPFQGGFIYKLQKKSLMPTYKLNGGPALVALCADGFYRPVDNGSDFHTLFGAYNLATPLQTTDSSQPNYVEPAKVLLEQLISITLNMAGSQPVNQ